VLQLVHGAGGLAAHVVDGVLRGGGEGRPGGGAREGERWTGESDRVAAAAAAAAQGGR